MAFTDFSDKVIDYAWGEIRIALGAAAIKGDILARDGTLADANANKPGYCVALEGGASGDEIAAAKGVQASKKTTVGTGGATTRGDHSGTADDVLWLSATAGKASATPVASIGQIVGVVLDQDSFVLEPSPNYWPLAELVAGNKTLDVQDCGKQMIVTADAVVITLPATGTEFDFTIVNGGNDGAQLISVSPNASDLITGPDYAGTDDKDWQNTKATARCNDYIKVKYRTATGWVVYELAGTWAQES